MWLLLSPSPGQNLSQLFYPDRLNLFLRHLFYLNDSGYFFSFVSISQINNSRPKPTYGRPGLDWIVWPGYSFGVFSMSRFAPPALSSVDAPKTLRDQVTPMTSFPNFLFLSFTSITIFLVQKFLKHIDKDMKTRLFLTQFEKVIFFRHKQTFLI